MASSPSKATLADVLQSPAGRSQGVRLRLLVVLLGQLNEATAFAPRQETSRLRIDHIGARAGALPELPSDGDDSGAAALAWEVMAGEPLGDEPFPLREVVEQVHADVEDLVSRAFDGGLDEVAEFLDDLIRFTENELATEEEALAAIAEALGAGSTADAAPKQSEPAPESSANAVEPTAPVSKGKKQEKGPRSRKTSKPPSRKPQKASEKPQPKPQKSDDKPLPAPHKVGRADDETKDRVKTPSRAPSAPVSQPPRAPAPESRVRVFRRPLPSMDDEAVPNAPAQTDAPPAPTPAPAPTPTPAPAPAPILAKAPPPLSETTPEEPPPASSGQLPEKASEALDLDWDDPPLSDAPGPRAPSRQPGARRSTRPSGTPSKKTSAVPSKAAASAPPSASPSSPPSSSVPSSSSPSSRTPSSRQPRLPMGVVIQSEPRKVRRTSIPPRMPTERMPLGDREESRMADYARSADVAIGAPAAEPHRQRLVILLSLDKELAVDVETRLRTLGFKVGRAQVDEFRRLRRPRMPDCIVSDYDSVGVAEFMEEIRSGAMQSTPLVLITRTKTVHAAFSRGADICIPAPASAAEIAAQVEAVARMRARLAGRNRQAISGDISQASLGTVLMILELERRTGVFHVKSQERHVTVEIDAGTAVTGTIDGKPAAPGDALRTAMSFTEGRFSVRDVGVSAKQEFRESLGALVMDSARALDEEARDEENER